jgi:hypothetical protein
MSNIMSQRNYASSAVLLLPLLHVGHLFVTHFTMSDGSKVKALSIFMGVSVVTVLLVALVWLGQGVRQGKRVVAAIVLIGGMLAPGWCLWLIFVITSDRRYSLFLYVYEAAYFICIANALYWLAVLQVRTSRKRDDIQGA